MAVNSMVMPMVNSCCEIVLAFRDLNQSDKVFFIVSACRFLSGVILYLLEVLFYYHLIGK